MNNLYESILSSTGSGKQAVYKKWLEDHSHGAKIENTDKGQFYISGLARVSTNENFPAGINIGYVNSVEASNITTFKGFPENCDYVTVFNAKTKNFEGCTQEDLKYFFVAYSDIPSLEGFPKSAERISIGENKQHYRERDIKKICKCNHITTLGTYMLGIGSVVIGEEEREYVMGVAEELEKMLMKDLKDLQRLDCIIDKKYHIFLNLVFEDNVGFEDFPNAKSVPGNPDYINNNVYISFIYLPETRELACFKHGALDTPKNWAETQPWIPGEVKRQIKTLDMPYRANGGKKFKTTKTDFFANDIHRKIIRYVKDVVDAAKKDNNGTLHRTTKTQFIK